MIGQLLNIVCAICLLLYAAMLFKAFSQQGRLFDPDKPVSIEDYIFKIARVTGNSEYDVFCKSAEDWPVSQEKIDHDFKTYLNHQIVPHYVNDFVRKNKKHVDELHLPRF